MMVGFGWLSDPLTAADQTGALSRLLAWSCLAAAAIALIVAIYFTFRGLIIREPQKESDLEFEGDDIGERLDRSASSGLTATAKTPLTMPTAD